MLEQVILYLITTILGMALGVVTSKLKKKKEQESEN